MANQTEGEIMCQAVGFWRLVRVGVVGESPRFGPATMVRLANCKGLENEFPWELGRYKNLKDQPRSDPEGTERTKREC